MVTPAPIGVQTPRRNTNLAADLTAEFGADTAAAIAQRFVTAVVGMRREIGAGGNA